MASSVPKEEHALLYDLYCVPSDTFLEIHKEKKKMVKLLIYSRILMIRISHGRGEYLCHPKFVMIKNEPNQYIKVKEVHTWCLLPLYSQS